MDSITVAVSIDARIETVWEFFNKPEHIVKWCFASDDWCCPRSANDLKTGGQFTTRMESKDGKMGFDFGGTYTNVKENELIEYIIGDGRKVKVEFTVKENVVNVVETFDPESQNPPEMQRGGWQAILDNFKKYVINNI